MQGVLKIKKKIRRQKVKDVDKASVTGKLHGAGSLVFQKTAFPSV
jgi:hypothetical protein